MTHVIGPVEVYKNGRRLQGEERSLHLIGRMLNRIEDTIHALHGGHRSPALETLDKLRLPLPRKRARHEHSEPS